MPQNRSTGLTKKEVPSNIEPTERTARGFPIDDDSQGVNVDTTAHTTPSVERSAIRKVATRLVPFVALMFFINYLDRTAIGFAGPTGMQEDLGLSAAQFGFASGVFFIGYILLEVPSNLALHRFGARRWLARIMVSWGIVAALFAWVQN